MSIPRLYTSVTMIVYLHCCVTQENTAYHLLRKIYMLRWKRIHISFCTYKFSFGQVVSSLYFAPHTQFSWWHSLASSYCCWVAVEELQIGAYLIEWVPVSCKAKFYHNFTGLNSQLSVNHTFDLQINNFNIGKNVI